LAVKYDIFYSFIKIECTPAKKKESASKTTVPKPYYKIQYAADKFGAPLGRYDAGELKINEITWNDHFYQEWSNFLDDQGTWKSGKKMAGKRARKEFLLKCYHNKDFVDPYPNGKPQATGLHRRVNNIFPGDSQAPAFEANTRDRQAQEVANRVEDPELFLPGTKILVSSSGVKENAFSELDHDPTNVVAKFLKGYYSAVGKHERDYKPIDHIESAFFKIGYRINREATKAASRWVCGGFGRCVLDCKAWKKALPYRMPSTVTDDYRTVVDRVRNEVEQKKHDRRRNDSLPSYRVQKRHSQDRTIQPSQSVTSSPSQFKSPSPSSVLEDEEGLQPQRPLPTTYSSNATFPGTHILCEPSGIFFDAYKEVSQSATSVIHSFLIGTIFANIDKPQPGKHTSLTQIESAFYKKGIRIDRWAALKASALVRNGEADTVLDTRPWKENQPVKLNPEKVSAIDTLIYDAQFNEGLFMYETSDDED